MSYDEQPDGDPHGECAAEIHRLEANLARVTAERDALRAVFCTVVRRNVAFSWDGTKQCHTPWIMVEFADVPSGEPNTAQGWRDRDAFDAAIDAARKGGS